MKTLLIVVVSLSALSITYGQKGTDSSVYYYDLGRNAYSARNFSAADSLFTLSLGFKPHRDTYYNRAMVRERLGNKNGFCQDLSLSFSYRDLDTKKIFWKNCGLVDTIFLDSAGNKAIKSKYFYQEINKRCELTGNYEKIVKDTKGVTIFAYEVSKGDTVFGAMPEKDRPEYPGGLSEMSKFIASNLHYPEIAKDKGIQGKVFLSFTIEPDGSVANIEVLKSPSPALDVEAVRILKKMPKWKPGTYQGRPVRVRHSQAINFKLN